MFPVLIALAAGQALSAMKQADEARSAADLQNALNEINARYIDYDAYEAEKFGSTEVAAYQPQIDQTIGAQRVALAAQNIDTGYGTASEFEKETKLTGALNVIEIQNQAREKAAGLRQEAANLRRGSSVQKDQANMNANASETAGLLNAGATGYRGYTQAYPAPGLKDNSLGTSNKSGNRVGWVPMNYGGDSYYKS